MFHDLDFMYIALVAAAVTVRILINENVKIHWRSTIVAALSAFVCARVLTTPILHRIPSEDPEQFREAVIVLLALTGHDLVAAVLGASGDPTILKKIFGVVFGRARSR